MSEIRKLSFSNSGVSEMLWCIKLSYFAENRWCPNINGVRKYMVNTVNIIQSNLSMAILDSNVLTRVVRRKRSSPERADRIRKQSLNIKD